MGRGLLGRGMGVGTATWTAELTQETNLSASLFRSCRPVALDMGAEMLLQADEGWQAWP